MWKTVPHPLEPQKQLSATMGQLCCLELGKFKRLAQHWRPRQKISPAMENLPNSENEFQVDIVGFASKTALVSIPNKKSGVVQITDKPMNLEEVLTQNGVSLDGSTVTRINLHRSGKFYSFTFSELMKSQPGKIVLKPDDLLMVDFLAYKPNKVFVLGAIEPTIINIDPTKRETLADILFTPSGVLSSTNAKRSEIYLLRGKNPITEPLGAKPYPSNCSRRNGVATK